MQRVKIKLAAGTHVGLIRKNNEDNFIVNKDLVQMEWLVPSPSEEIDLGDLGCLLVVADGMGGANAGEVASAIAIDTVQKSFTPDNLKSLLVRGETEKEEKKIEDFLVSVIKAADLNILNAGKDDSSTQGMGTTIVLTWIINDKAYIVWCGDSRCYVFNPQSGICRLSKDHSFVQELVDQGKLDAENAISHPCSNIITRCLGDPSTRAIPDFRVYNLKNGDTLLLCSDGLCGLCQDDEIIQVMDEYQDDIGGCRDKLIEAALTEGGYDNVTVALCNVIQNKKEEQNELGMTRMTQYRILGWNSFFRFVLILFLIAVIAGIGYCVSNHSFGGSAASGTETDTIATSSSDTIHWN